jgi:MoxR-like ATPase
MMEEENKPADFENRIDLSQLSDGVARMRTEFEKYVVGQPKMLDLLLVALLADGHALIEGVPGVAKTMSAKLLARLLKVDFSRLQFTPDLMPSDVLGTSVYNQKNSTFEYQKGPVFSNVVLIDEINRAPAKTQAALFEVMEERQVTADGQQFKMDFPYLVLATQNPIEQEGTYRLPEAQLDRFLVKISVGYPTQEDEESILNLHHTSGFLDVSKAEPILDAEQVKTIRKQVQSVQASKDMLRYIAELVQQTRSNKNLFLGASPRASIALLNTSKAMAAMQGRDFINPDDIQFLLEPVLGHRIILSPEKEMEGLSIGKALKQIASKVEVPR